jgi:hypothetical protein
MQRHVVQLGYGRDDSRAHALVTEFALSHEVTGGFNAGNLDGLARGAAAVSSSG